MPEATPLQYGAHPGLRFACVLDGRGGCRDLGWSDVEAWQPGAGVLWIHVERDDPRAQAWMRERSGIDPLIVESLLAEESRPRVETVEDGLLVVLRGVNRRQGEDPIDLVPLHVWGDADRVISLRDKDHYLMALRDIRETLTEGHGVLTAGQLFALIADKVVKYVEPLIEELEDQVDALDEGRLTKQHAGDTRTKLNRIRRSAVSLRRYLAPQREALFRLQAASTSWFSERDRIQIREVTDKVLRHVESLDSIRDRTTLLQEELTAEMSERIASNSHRLTAIAALLLPPSLLAGMLGANIGGIPGTDDPWAFVVLCFLVVVIFPLELWVLRRLGWL